MLDADFMLYSPGSHRLVDYAEQGRHGQALLTAEIDRTATAIKTAIPDRIAKGVLDEAEAVRILATFMAIAADLAAEREYWAALDALWSDAGANLATGSPQLADFLAAVASGDDPPIAWPDKVEALRREITHRRASFEADVSKGRLDPAEARDRLERIEAVHDKYWRQMFAWQSPTGAAAASIEWRNEIREHVALVDQAEQMQEQAA